MWKGWVLEGDVGLCWLWCKNLGGVGRIFVGAGVEFWE